MSKWKLYPCQHNKDIDLGHFGWVSFSALTLNLPSPGEHRVWLWRICSSSFNSACCLHLKDWGRRRARDGRVKKKNAQLIWSYPSSLTAVFYKADKNDMQPRRRGSLLDLASCLTMQHRMGFCFFLFPVSLPAITGGKIHWNWWV